MSDEYIAGSVLSVLRYPVKSMMGEELTASDVMESGLIGDRDFALIDNSTGKIASAKNPRKWARLFDCHASSLWCKSRFLDEKDFVIHSDRS